MVLHRSMTASSPRWSATAWETSRSSSLLQKVRQAVHGVASGGSHEPSLGATQHDLSPADTDLIEITLTTLFAVDKLQHLLRNRRRALTLLNYRLQYVPALRSSVRQLRRARVAGGR